MNVWMWRHVHTLEFNLKSSLFRCVHKRRKCIWTYHVISLVNWWCHTSKTQPWESQPLQLETQSRITGSIDTSALTSSMGSIFWAPLDSGSIIAVISNAGSSPPWGGTVIILRPPSSNTISLRELSDVAQFSVPSTRDRMSLALWETNINVFI